MPHNMNILHSMHDSFYVDAVNTENGILVDRPYGGVAILWHKSLNMCVKIIIDNNDSRLMGIVIKRGDTTYHILNVYLPTESADNLPDFTHCLYKIHTLFKNNDTVITWVDKCHENNYVLGDQSELTGKTFTFHSDVHDTVSWLDHALCSMSMYQIIDHMSVLYQYLTSDHFPLSLYHKQLFQNKHPMMYKWALLYKKLTGDNYLLKLCQTICTQLMFYSEMLFYLMM